MNGYHTILGTTGQPLTIIGTTGPLLAFLKVLFDACNKANVPFLPVYAWTGLWSSLLLFLSSFFSLSNVVEVSPQTKMNHEFISGEKISALFSHVAFTLICI